jgi:protein-S-isoprenylcysteine O-methyltransferase Ste14
MFKTRIPPPLYALFAGLTMLGLHRYLPGPTILDAHLAPWAWLAAVAGGLLASWAAMTFRRARTTLDPTAPSKASRLVTQGPYRLTRNPIYLGLLLILLGWAGWLDDLSGFFVLPLFMAVVTFQQILPEERALETLFGEEYTCYQQRVNRWIGRRPLGGRAANAHRRNRLFPDCHRRRY